VLLASRNVVEEIKRNLHNQDQLHNIETYLSNVQIVLEADQRLECPIDFPDKDKPVLIAANFCQGRLSDHG